MKFKKSMIMLCSLLPFLAHAQNFKNSSDIFIGSDMTYYPYEYVKDNEKMGFDIEFMQQVSKFMNRKPVFMDTRFTNLIIGLRSGKYDIMSSSLYITPQRLASMDMIPYLKGGQSIVMLKQSEEALTDMKMLCGKKVATMQGSFAARQMEAANNNVCKASGNKENNITILEFPSNPEATRALFNHAADAQLTDAALAQGLIQRMGNNLKITSAELLSPVLIGIGVRKGDAEIKSALEAGIKSFEETPEYQMLLDKYGFKRLTSEEIKELLPQQG